jgi:ABC-type Mn2+/Zn2+ transport system permease subunit
MKHAAIESLGSLAAKSAPPITVLTGAAAGVNWQEWVWVATFAYIVLQFGLLFWDRIIKPNVRKPRP